jgi:hypothetical protein
MQFLVPPNYTRDRGVVFLRVGGVWTAEIVPAELTAYTALAHHDSLGFVLGLVEPDATHRPGDGNSLFVWLREAEWRPAQRLVLSAREGDVFRPHLTFVPAGGLFTWLSYPDGEPVGVPAEVRVRLWPSVGAADAIRVVASGVEAFVPPLMYPGGSPLWVTSHSTSENPSRAELRFTTLSHDSVPVVLARLPGPPFRLFRAAKTGRNELLLFGMVVETEDGFPVSLLRRVRIRCPHAAPDG